MAAGVSRLRILLTPHGQPRSRRRPHRPHAGVKGASGRSLRFYITQMPSVALAGTSRYCFSGSTAPQRNRPRARPLWRAPHGHAVCNAAADGRCAVPAAHGGCCQTLPWRGAPAHGVFLRIPPSERNGGVRPAASQDTPRSPFMGPGHRSRISSSQVSGTDYRAHRTA